MAQQRELDGSRHPERHRTDRVGWLRAAVLGANDGIVSTASLLVGVAAAEADHGAVMLAGAAGLVAGAMSMAAGEYVSVSSQADTERADLARERQELADDAAAELAELTGIYVNRGLEPSLAQEVALQLTRHDALGAHARDELGITASLKARPVQAALTSAAMFSIGAALPLATASLLPASRIAAVVSLTSLLFLGVLGGLSARAGGAQVHTAVVRVTVWGAMAMAATALIGVLLGVGP
ncbi:VIT family protein [Synechococcus sp. CS-205]|uniref:VIT1/CCC1 transporter family protein n=1 Tax=Synechococcus sp. CS-205 TaxID=2847984 RepID=UPI00223AA1F9|nr:VIT family protein [Synechococcus sp. CS-205]MCT0248448.1 VIT family protein [Synechococcus sp. CS-205]